MAVKKGFLIALISLLLSLIIIKSANHCIYIWDESIYANNAVEMAQSGRPFIYTYNGVPDHHNSKPPLVIWLQALSLKAFHYHDWAVRLPVWLALAGICILFAVYSRKLTGGMLPGLLACVVLLTSGAVRHHIYLSGDLDGVLTFFSTGLCLHFLAMLRTHKISDRDLYLLFVWALPGYFAKSTAILLLAPSLLLSLLLSGKAKAMFARPAFYAGLFLFVAIIALYYILRERTDPGYWQVVWLSEFRRIDTDVQPWLRNPPGLYFDDLRRDYFSYQLILLALLLPPFILLRCKQAKLTGHLLMIAAVFLLVLSFPVTRLPWYDAPVYPLLALALGIVLHELLAKGLGLLKNPALQAIVFCVLIIALFTYPFLKMQNRIQDTIASYSEPDFAPHALTKLNRYFPDVTAITVLAPLQSRKYIHLMDGILFYQKAWKASGGKSVVLDHNINELHTGDTVLACHQEQLDSLRQKYQTTALDSCAPCYWLKLASARRTSLAPVSRH